MPVIRTFDIADGTSVSNLIRLILESSNSADYPPDRLRLLGEYFSPAKVTQLNQERHCLVAEEGGSIIGTAAIEADHIVTFFVHPGHQRRGIGRALLRALEQAALGLGVMRLTVEPSLTGAAFYERLGYSRTGRVLDSFAGPQIEVEKALRSTGAADA